MNLRVARGLKLQWQCHGPRALFTCKSRRRYANACTSDSAITAEGRRGKKQTKHEQGVEVRRSACKTWERTERHEEGADMRLEDTKGKLHLCLLSLFCALTSAVVTE